MARSLHPSPGLSPPGVPYVGSLNNSGGTLTGSNAGLSLTSANLTEIRGITGADLGTVTFTTGPLVYGSLQGGGFFNTTGSLLITLNPNVLGGKLSGGATLFNGSFEYVYNFPYLSWTAEGGGLYLLQGAAYGTLPNGSNGQAFINETFYGSFNSNGMFTGTVVSGSIDVNPEPGTLGLFATGLVGVAGAVRRKLRT